MSDRERIARVIAERVELAEHDPVWATWFARERDHLRACLPADLIGRIEHFGSTAVPGLVAKPIVDMLIEVHDLDRARHEIPPILQPPVYDYFWRPTHGDDGPPFYVWFIKRDGAKGRRTHHLHFVPASFGGHWDRLRFRDRLVADAAMAERYGRLKRELVVRYANDRLRYTRSKGEFIEEVMAGPEPRPNPNQEGS